MSILPACIVYNYKLATRILSLESKIDIVGKDNLISTYIHRIQELLYIKYFNVWKKSELKYEIKFFHKHLAWN